MGGRPRRLRTDGSLRDEGTAAPRASRKEDLAAAATVTIGYTLLPNIAAVAVGS